MMQKVHQNDFQVHSCTLGKNDIIEEKFHYVLEMTTNKQMVDVCIWNYTQNRMSYNFHYLSTLRNGLLFIETL